MSVGKHETQIKVLIVQYSPGLLSLPPHAHTFTAGESTAEWSLSLGKQIISHPLLPSSTLETRDQASLAKLYYGSKTLGFALLGRNKQLNLPTVSAASFACEEKPVLPKSCNLSTLC